MFMTNTNEIIPAEAERPCSLCGRIHRKLYYAGAGYWMGKNCLTSYTRFTNGDKNITSMFWKGYEKQYQRCVNLAKG